jgi:hypothetical protein
VFEDRLHAYLAIIDSGDESARDRDLKDSVDRVFEIPGEHLGDDGRNAPPALRRFLVERNLERRWNIG